MLTGTILEGTYMAATDDIKKLRVLLRAEAQNAPLGRERKGSKAAKVRELYQDLLAIKKRLPHATLADLTKMLQNIGLDVKIDSVARVMRSEQAARPQAKRARKLPSSSTESKAERQDGSADKVHDEDRTAAKSEEATNAPASITPRISLRIDPNSFAGIRRLNMKV
jgi:hypothetical protein